MSKPHFLWAIPEIVATGFIRLLCSAIKRVDSSSAKRLIFLPANMLYVINYQMTFFIMRHASSRRAGSSQKQSVVHVLGPFLRRKGDAIMLGDMIRGAGREFAITVLGGEPVIKASGTPEVDVTAGKVRKVSERIHTFSLSVVPKDICGRTGFFVSIHPRRGRERKLFFSVRGVRELGTIKEVKINRLKNGASFAFSWRIDWDHATAPEKLLEFFRLAEKWGIPPTIYMSGMVLDEKLYADFITAHGRAYELRDLRQDMFRYREIPSLDEMRESKKLLSRQRFDAHIEFPIGRFAAEAGNHMHHHYGGPETGFLRLPKDEAALKQDAKRMHSIIRQTLKATPETWSRPAGEKYPESFIAFLRSLGYTSVSNFRHIQSPLQRPCLRVMDVQGILEVRSNYPRDPAFMTDVETLKATVDCCGSGASGIDAHLIACSHLGPPFVLETSGPLGQVFEKALESSSWICTVSAFTEYVRTATKTRASIEGPRSIRITNGSGNDASGIPLEITYDGGRDVIVSSCPKKSSRDISF
jgi:hypothetical protein